MGDFSSSEGSGSHTIIPPTRRPDGSLRKPIRVRAGYVPQDEIGAWESPAKRMQREREAVGVPGWEDAPGASSTPSPSISYTSSSRGIVGGEGTIKPSSAAAPMTKSQKRNLARKKGREEKRQEKTDVEGITSAMAEIKISAQDKSKKTDSRSSPAPSASTSSNTVDELGKKVKALQKKLRQVTQLQAKVDAGEVTPTDEQLEKLKKRTQFEKELNDLQTALDAASAKQ
jgi:partner of Y14 and mago protein